MDNTLSCFKAYDIRGKVPDELNEELAVRIGRAYATLFEPRKVAIGHDVRTTSPGLSKALASGLTAAGVDVLDLGLCGTEEVNHRAGSTVAAVHYEFQRFQSLRINITQQMIDILRPQVKLFNPPCGGCRWSSTSIVSCHQAPDFIQAGLAAHRLGLLTDELHAVVC